MKKQSIILLMSILISVLFFSCKQKTIKTEELDFAKKYYLVSDTSKGALKVEIQVEIPSDYYQKNILDSIRKTIISNLFSPRYIFFANDTIAQKFATDIALEYRLNNQSMVEVLDSGSVYSFNNDHNLSGFSLLSDKNIYVYAIERYVFMGGAHGYETRNYFNFNLKTGELLTEKDLFVNNYVTELSELIKMRIVEISKEDNEVEPIIKLEDTDYWTDSIKPNGNFYITDESINYVFNPYEIAPFYMGQTEVNIPFDRLKSILKVESPIAYLVQKHAN